jgi:hypothetical protein
VHAELLRCLHVLITVVDEEEVAGFSPQRSDAMAKCGGVRLDDADVSGHGNEVELVQPGLRFKERVGKVGRDVGQQGHLSPILQRLHVGDHVVVDA